MNILTLFKKLLFRINPYYRLIINTRLFLENKLVETSSNIESQQAVLSTNLENRLNEISSNAEKKLIEMYSNLSQITTKINSINERLSKNENFPKKVSDISEVISSKDQMFYGNFEHYFIVSKSAIECILTAISMADRVDIVKQIRKILDLPCGYGRVLRSLKAYFPQAEITACDLDKDGVDFCVNTFNAIGVYSDPNVAKINISSKYDLIWCGSLLTHLEEKKTLSFLDFFIDKLEENGILVASLHGRFSQTIQNRTSIYIENERFETILQDYNNVGYGYADYEGQTDYGISMSKPSWIFSHLEKRDDVTVIYYSERLWDKHQDILALRKKSILQ